MLRLEVIKQILLAEMYIETNAQDLNIYPFQSNFGASNLVSYSPPDPNYRQKVK